MEAALGLGQLERLDAIIQTRRGNAEKLSTILAPYEQYLQLPWYDPAIQEHAFMMYPIVVRPGAPFTKWDLVKYLEEWNVETRDMMPMLTQPVYEPMHLREDDFPVAQMVDRGGFYIGSHQGLKPEHLAYVDAVFRQFFTDHALL
jgi:CDP-6-deoxy-D-xylo-4-hexulose-3-dehydrase